MLDEAVASAIRCEKERQESVLELIPSENIASRAVREAMASVFCNKYSEGYPHKRYYAGNECVDLVEELAIERAKKLFGCEHANVQSYSGSPANLEVYAALLEIGDKAMALSLSEGGHLTHGHKVNFSGRVYDFVHYSVDKETEMLDYDAIEVLARKEKPKLIVSGYTAYPRSIDFKRFAEIAESVGAYSMADIAHIAGLIAGGAHSSPFPFTDVVTTTTHKTLRGPRGAMIMCKEELAQRIDKAVFPGMQGGPHEHSIAAKAVCFHEAMQPSFKEYAKQIVSNAKALADALKARGYRLVTGGTDNHLILIDLTSKEVTGKEAERALDKAGVTVNANTIPFDKRKPWDPSGIRIGTPVITTRGMREGDMARVAEFLDSAVECRADEAKLSELKAGVRDFTARYPIEKVI